MYNLPLPHAMIKSHYNLMPMDMITKYFQASTKIKIIIAYEQCINKLVIFETWNQLKVETFII
jgi:hypothetical protein